MKEEVLIEISEWSEAGLKEIFDLVKDMHGLKITISKTDDVYEDQNEKVVKFLTYCGVANSSNGYRYLQTAICAGLKDQKNLYDITKYLYPEIAKIYHVEPQCIERSMRNSIENAWKKDNGETIKGFFGNSMRRKDKKPSNSAFIAQAVDVINLYGDHFHDISA